MLVGQVTFFLKNDLKDISDFLHKVRECQGSKMKPRF